MTIQLTEAHCHTMRAEGERAFPHECCGFLLGCEIDRIRQVRDVVPVDNAREDAAQHHRYLITPEDYMRMDKQARQQDMDVVGFYHSHPDAPARPSQIDTENGWPWYAYVIVSVLEGAAGDMTAWVLADDRSAFRDEKLLIVD